MAAPEPSVPAPSTTPLLRLVDGPRPAPAPHGAWTLLVTTLAASAGHGLFLATALTRLRSLPSRAELGGVLETLVIGWFVASVPLTLLALALRARFQALAPAAAWRSATVVAGLAALAFGLYLRAVAL